MIKKVTTANKDKPVSRPRPMIAVSQRAFGILTDMRKNSLAYAKLIDYLLIKTGYLKVEGRELIEHQAVERFLKGEE